MTEEAPYWHALFFAKVGAPDEKGCCIWLGGFDHDGYGRFGLNRRNRHAHRVAWCVATGVYPARNVEVMHECDQRSCVNPAHLKLGTHAENMADMAAKGRASRKAGEQNPNAKLSAAHVLEIRNGFDPAETVAAKFQLHVATVYKIRRGVLWPS